jgi:dTDP-4-amino-4,6-dideoxygalactose transaminase
MTVFRRPKLGNAGPISWWNNLANTDFVMDRVFWIGMYPGITDPMVEYILDAFRSLLAA